jgi:uncharacterized membrane protein
MLDSEEKRKIFDFDDKMLDKILESILLWLCQATLLIFLLIYSLDESSPMTNCKQFSWMND